jgi:hypothetical protein
MPQMDWPHVYHVTLREGLGLRVAEYDVLSWLGGHKAVAMAMEQHARQPESWPVYDVDVWDTGPAPKEPDGTVGHGPPGYLEDRVEF